MSVAERVRESQMLLEQITWDPKVVLWSLSRKELERLVKELGVLDDKAASVRTEADLLAVTDAIDRLARKIPTPVRPLPPRETGVTEVPKRRRTRKITVTDHEAAYRKSLYAQEYAAHIRNRVVECRQELEQTLQEISRGEKGSDG